MTKEDAVMAKSSKNAEQITEAVGVFKSEENLQEAMDDLRVNGFARRDLSVLADTDKYKNVKDAEDSSKAPRTSYIPLEAIGDAQGALIALPTFLFAMITVVVTTDTGASLMNVILATLLIGGLGAILGYFLSRIVAKHHKEYIQRQMDRGGLLLWVNLMDKKHEKSALNILKKYKAKDVHVHKVAV